MIKEELKQEAKVYSYKLYHSKAWNPGEDMLVKAYLAGAEPREKRIAELEATCNKWFEHLKNREEELLNELNNQNVEYNKQIEELEKENAELDCQKNRNKYCYSCANVTERCFKNEIGCPCDNYKSYKDENEELRNNGFTVSAMTEQQLKVALEKGEQLEKENAELSEKLSEQNAGENHIEGGVVSISGSVEKQYRPFNDCNELIGYWCVNYEGVAEQHIKSFVKQKMPCIWIRDKTEDAKGDIELITGFTEHGNVLINGTSYPLQHLFQMYEFLDGTPVGMEE
jgi:hypothetical protein